MRNPFPGMNPYLEQPALWHQVHNRLIIATLAVSAKQRADELTPQIAPEYRVSIEERVYTSVDDSLLVGIADVAVSRNNTSRETLHLVSTLPEPVKVKVPLPEEVTERFLEVRSTRTGAVVAVIEVLSPKNKRSREGRDAYLTKRQKILASATHLVEIDLLRVGEPMPIVAQVPESTYRILVSRSDRRPDADLYIFGLCDRIPTISVPLKIGEPEAIVDLQKLLDDVYQRARFDLAIDYSQPLKPAVSPEEAAWIAQVLEQADQLPGS